MSELNLNLDDFSLGSLSMYEDYLMETGNTPTSLSDVKFVYDCFINDTVVVPSPIVAPKKVMLFFYYLFNVSN